MYISKPTSVIIVISILILLILGNDIFAQIKISGTVLDSIGNAVENAKLLFIYNNDTTRTHSNSDGYYEENLYLTSIRQEISKIETFDLLSQNYPNPFNPSTVINVHRKGILIIYNTLGQKLVEEEIENSVTKLNKDLPAGVYFYKLQSTNKTLVRKMVLTDGGKVEIKIKLNEKEHVKSNSNKTLKANSSVIKIICTHMNFHPDSSTIVSEDNSIIVENYILNKLPSQSFYVDKDGGSFIIENDSEINGTRINIPPSALNKGQIISIKQNLTPPIITDSFLESAGPCLSINSNMDSVFFKPIEMTFPIDVLETDSLRLFRASYYNSDSLRWEIIDHSIIDTIPEFLTFTTNHFSDFSILRLIIDPDNLTEYLENSATFQFTQLYIEIKGENRCNEIEKIRDNLFEIESSSFETLMDKSYTIEWCNHWLFDECTGENVEHWIKYKLQEKFLLVSLESTLKMLGAVKAAAYLGAAKGLLAIAGTPCMICILDNSSVNPEFWNILGTNILANYGIDMANKALDGKCNEVETGTVTDIDGNVYKTIKIGNQWWMAENLKVTRYRNGESIPNVTDNSQWFNLTTGARCAYNNDNNNADTYGLLYNWYAVNDNRNIAPEGWRVPTDEEWKQLEMYLGMSQSEADATSYRGSPVGGKLKEAGTVHWNSPNSGATNESGFTALPGGFRFHDGGIFYDMSYFGCWWAATEISSTYALGRYMYYNSSDVERNYYNKQDGFSIRCVRD